MTRLNKPNTPEQIALRFALRALERPAETHAEQAYNVAKAMMAYADGATKYGARTWQRASATQPLTLPKRQSNTAELNEALRAIGRFDLVE